jgi:hypothetical protein
MPVENRICFMQDGIVELTGSLLLSAMGKGGHTVGQNDIEAEIAMEKILEDNYALNFKGWRLARQGCGNGNGAVAGG